MSSVSRLHEPVNAMIEPLLIPRAGYAATKLAKEVTRFLTAPPLSTERLHLHTMCTPSPQGVLRCHRRQITLTTLMLGWSVGSTCFTSVFSHRLVAAPPWQCHQEPRRHQGRRQDSVGRSRGRTRDGDP